MHSLPSETKSCYKTKFFRNYSTNLHTKNKEIDSDSAGVAMCYIHCAQLLSYSWHEKYIQGTLQCIFMSPNYIIWSNILWHPPSPLMNTWEWGLCSFTLSMHSWEMASARQSQYESDCINIVIVWQEELPVSFLEFFGLVNVAQVSSLLLPGLYWYGSIEG